MPANEPAADLNTMESTLALARAAQRVWAKKPMRARLAILRQARHSIAEHSTQLAQAVPCESAGALHRSVADTLVAEVLPLVEACRYLEREAEWILSPQRLSTHSRPFWLGGVSVQITRDPLGVVLIIGPANYPLFLPGVQALQALIAGNAVLWKPAPGGAPVANVLRSFLMRAGLEPALLQILDETPQAAAFAIEAAVDKVVLTGSAQTGAAVLSRLAPHLTPAVMELSGCDAMFVLPGADSKRVKAALAFGLRLNGSATCMAPRRLFLIGDQQDLIAELQPMLAQLPAVSLPVQTEALLKDLLDDASRLGGSVIRVEAADGLRTAMVTNATSAMRLAQADIFAPVLCIFSVSDIAAALAAHAACPYVLTAAVFGPARAARALADQLSVGTVLLNDLIVATADPRVPFSGRKKSGFGVTRGREGLLEMTQIKTVVTQRSRSLRPYQPTTQSHESFFASYLETVHGGSWRARWRGLRRLFHSAGKLG